MRELKIFAFIVIVVGILYWGVEPLAHSVFYPKSAPADFAFSDLEKLPTDGDIENGKALAATCNACHGIKQDGLPALMTDDLLYAAYGVVPPDLSHIGAIYDANFLANLIKDPIKALKLTHKFNDEKPFPMPPAGLSDEEIGDIVAYFKSIGERSLNQSVLESEEYKIQAEAIKKNAINKEQKEALSALKRHLTNKEVFKDACLRCHSMKYDKLSSLTPEDVLVNYMGAKAPDLSMMIRSRGEERLHKFINDPQKIISGTSMPRVGLSQNAQNQVVKYMESVGDSKKSERESLGIILIGFMVIMAILAYLWKRKIWHNLH